MNSLHGYDTAVIAVGWHGMCYVCAQSSKCPIPGKLTRWRGLGTGTALVVGMTNRNMTSTELNTVACRILSDATPSELQTLATFGYKDELSGFSTQNEYNLRCAVQDLAKERTACL